MGRASQSRNSTQSLNQLSDRSIEATPTAHRSVDNSSADLQRYHRLTPFKIRDVLIIASPFDNYVLEESGYLSDLIAKEYNELNLTQAPRFIHSPNAEDALTLLRTWNFDLIITMARIGTMKVHDFAQRAADLQPGIKVVLLAYNTRELATLRGGAGIERTFVWHGDSRIILAICKLMEDMKNAHNDVTNGDVQVILLVEDSRRFYSSYLPILYRMLVEQTSHLMFKGANQEEKMLRLRARAKILLATNYEEAMLHLERYEKNIIGVITDGRFPNADGDIDNAGLDLVKVVRKKQPHMPILFQSKNLELQPLAEELGTTFLHKEDHALHRGIEKFMKHEMSFGDFIFRDDDGEEIARASDLSELRKVLKVAPIESVVNHAERNHFSHWMRTRTEFNLAAKIRPRKRNDFTDDEDIRNYLIQEIENFLADRRARQVRNYEKGLEKVGGFQRLGSGTLGGKGRGLAFFYTKMPDLGIAERFPDVDIVVPKSLVIATDVFEEFVKRNSLQHFSSEEHEDHEVQSAFLAGEFLEEEEEILRRILGIVDWPLAVRSSSLLEDALHQPFAGVYDTFFLPNDHEDPKVRASQLSDAIKLVFASTYSKRSKAYVAATPNSIEEERMAVVVQELVGSKHEGMFYPLISGVARSRNHYPVAPIKSEDGVAAIALGLGLTVADGGRCLRFSPAHPKRILQLSYSNLALNEGQTSFWALKMGLKEDFKGVKITEMLAHEELSTAEVHGRLATIASTYVASDDRMFDGIARDGPRILTFHGPLKRGSFPLPEILNHVLSTCEEHLSCPVEIEFAVDFDNETGRRSFSLLQLRPLLSIGVDIDVDLQSLDKEQIICASSLSLGTGIIEGIRDVVYVNPSQMNRMRTRDIVPDLERVNATLNQQNRPYILIGPGRWGSSDPSLGIPVSWDQISGAKAIVEARMGDIHVEPSQGSHFFQNIVSFNVGYLTITSQDDDVDWQWLDSHDAEFENGPLRHISLDKEIRVLLDSRDGEAVIDKG